MKASCIIDNVDIATLGAFIQRGGSNDLLSFPSRVKPDANNWAEYDGLDVDLSNCSFRAKSVNIRYCIVADSGNVFNQNLSTFQNMHFAAGYRIIYIREFAKTFELRFEGFSDYNHKGGLIKKGTKTGFLTASYVMDNPLQMFQSDVIVPNGTLRNLSYISLNGIDLSRFGIIVEDAYSTMLNKGLVKKRLEKQSIIDVGTTAKRQARHFRIKCVMIANDLAEFYKNYEALFNNIRLQQSIMLEMSAINKSINCYYESMTEFEKNSLFKERIKVKFNLNFKEI